MVFKGSDGDNKKFIGTACLVKKLGKRGEGKYAIITVAHNFRMVGYEYMSSKFILQRSNSEYLAMFNVKNYHIHEEYELNEISIQQGYDMALAEVVINPNNKVELNIVDQ